MTGQQERIEQLIASDPGIAKLTPEAVAKALEGLRRPKRQGEKSARSLEPDGGVDWFARAIRGALYAAQATEDEAADRSGNRRTRAELFKIAKKIEAAELALSKRSREADSAIWDYTARDGGTHGEPPQHAAFLGAVAQLGAIAPLLRRSGTLLEVQQRGWRLRAQRDLRVRQAQHLAEVYRLAFGMEPATHTRPGSSPVWPELYRRIVRIAFGLRGTNDIPGLLDEARLGGRVTIAHGFIPDKPL